MIHLTSKLTEDERFLIRMRLDHLEKSFHLLRPTNPFLCLCLILFGNTIKIHLWPNHGLSSTKKTFQNNHILGVDADGIPECITNSILCLEKDNLIELLLIWVHIQFDILKMTWR